MKLKESATAWTVRYTMPRTILMHDKTERQVQCNHCSVVIAIITEDAISLVIEEFPEAKIVSVNPGPIGAVIVDDSLIG
jgi:hypothetical protein